MCTLQQFLTPLCLESWGPTHWWPQGFKRWGDRSPQSLFGSCAYDWQNSRHTLTCLNTTFITAQSCCILNTVYSWWSRARSTRHVGAFCCHCIRQQQQTVCVQCKSVEPSGYIIHLPTATARSVSIPVCTTTVYM